MPKSRGGARIRCLAGLALCALLGPAAASAPAGVEDRLSGVVEAARAAGFSGEVLVADAQDVWHEQAVGMARRAPEVQHVVGAVWRWGSVSKQITATLAMQLVDEGRLRLDDTLAERWPAFRAPGAARITVRHLMQHLSGLANSEDSPAAKDGVPSFHRREGPPWQPETLRYCAGPAQATPGERFRYNNCDTLVLAGLLEHVTGEPVDRLLQQRVAQPLALRSQRLNEGQSLAEATALDKAGGPVPQPVMATYGEAGAMEGTARDLLAFNRALLRGSVVSAAARQTVWTGEPRWGYAALGLWAFPAPLKGCSQRVELVERRGCVGGIQARNIIAPATGVSVVVFTNQADVEFGEIWQGRGLAHDLLAAALCRTAGPTAVRKPG